jgi:Na+-driven multidrug efflux pump
MLNTSVSFALIFALLCVGFGPVLAQSQGEVDARLAENVKQAVLVFGVGPKALVVVELRNETKLAGYISEAAEDTFSIVDPRTRVTTTVAYTQPAKVSGQNLSTGAKIGIGIAIGIGVVFLIAYILFRSWNGPRFDNRTAEVPAS